MAVDVHAHLGTIWDYYAQEHGIYGWQNGRIVSAVVHVGDRLPLALFDGRRLLFGDGDGAAYLPMGAALDVVAHEYSHALLRALSDLAPEGESRAVEEGGADLFACLIEQAAQPAQGGWTIGEQIHRSGGHEAPIRDLIDPRRSDQARSLAEVRGSAMSVSKSREELAHFSSGIVGHAGYLMAKQLGGARTAAILRRAFSVYLFHFAGFSDFADATLMAVQDLYGGGGPEARAVARAWSAVGVGTIETIGESADP
jgi:Zn-dependent metalloprotease